MIPKRWDFEKPKGLMKYLPISMHLDSGIYLPILRPRGLMKYLPISMRSDLKKSMLIPRHWGFVKQIYWLKDLKKYWPKLKHLDSGKPMDS